MAKKEDPAKVAQRKQERVAFVQANPNLAPEQARQRFFVQTRMNELAATGSLGDRKALREKFQSGGVTREGFYTPGDKKRIAADNAEGPPGTGGSTSGSGEPPVVVTPTVTPTVTGSTTSTTMPKSSTTSTTTPTRPTTNTTTTPNQYDKPTTTTALGQVTSTTTPKTTTTTPAVSTTKTSGGGFFDSGVGKFLRDTTTDNPNVGLQGIFNRNLPNVTKLLQMPGDAIDDLGRTFVAPAVNLATSKTNRPTNFREATPVEAAITTAFTLADIVSAGSSMGLRAPVTQIVKSQITKRLGKETVENIAAKTAAAKGLIPKLPTIPKTKASLAYDAEQLALNAPKPLSSISGAPGNPSRGAIMDFGPTANPKPPVRGTVKPPVVSVKPTAALKPVAPGNPSLSPKGPGNPSRSPKGPNAAPLTPAQKRAATIAAKKQAKLEEAKAAEALALEGKQGDLKAPMKSPTPSTTNLTATSKTTDPSKSSLETTKSPSSRTTTTYLTGDETPVVASKKTKSKDVNGKTFNVDNVSYGDEIEDRFAGSNEVFDDDILPSEIVNREKYDAFGNSTNNDPLIRRVGEEPAGQGPFDSPRSVGPQSLDQAKRRTRRQADPDADEASAMITGDQLDRARLENVPMSRLITNNIDTIRADRATRNADRVRDYESRRYPTIDDMSGNPIPTPATNKPVDSPQYAADKIRWAKNAKLSPEKRDLIYPKRYTNPILRSEFDPSNPLMNNTRDIVRDADEWVVAAHREALVRRGKKINPSMSDMSGRPIPTPATNKPLEGVFNANGKVSKKFTDDPAVLAAREEAKKEVAAAGQLKKNTRNKTKRVEKAEIKKEEVEVQKVVKTENQPLQTPVMSQPQKVRVTPEIRERVNPPGVDPELSSLDVPVAPAGYSTKSEPFLLTSRTEYDTFVDVTKNPMTGQANQQSTIELARSLGQNESIPGQAAKRGREFGAGEFEKNVTELKTIMGNFENKGKVTQEYRDLERKLRQDFGGERFDRIVAAASGEDVPTFRSNTPPLTQTLNMPDMPSGQSLSEFQQVFGKSAKTPSVASKLPELQTNAFAPYSPTKNPGRMRGTSLDEQVASWRNLSTSKEFQDMMVNQPDLAAFIARQNKPFQDVLERQAAADSAALEARLSASVEDKAWATVQEASGKTTEAALTRIREGKDKFIGGPENINNPLRGTEINPVDPSKQVPVYIQDWSKPSTWRTEFPRQNAIKMSQEEVLKRDTVQSVAVQYDETQRVLSQAMDRFRTTEGTAGEIGFNDFDSAIIDELNAAGMDMSQFRQGTSRFNKANRASNNLPYSDPNATYPTSGTKANPWTPEQAAARNAAMDQPAGWSLDPFGSFNPPRNNQVVLGDPASLSAAGKDFRANMDALLEQAPDIAANFELGLAKSRKSIARREAVMAKRKIATEVGQEASKAEATAWWREAKPYFKKQEEIKQAADLAAAERPQLTQRMRMEQDQAQKIASLEQTPVNNNTAGPMTVSDPGPYGTYDPLIGAHVFEWSNPLTGTAFRTETIYGPATDKAYRTVQSSKTSYTLKSQTKESTAEMVEEAQRAAREIDANAQEIINDWRNG